MEKPARIDLHADRHVPCFRKISFVGFDFTGATLVSQVRLKPETSGSALISLTATGSTTAEGVRLHYTGSDTVENHILAGNLSAVPRGLALATNVSLSVVSIQIVEATMEGLPAAPVTDPSRDIVLAWDLHITPSGGIKDKYAGGDFVVRAGVTAT